MPRKVSRNCLPTLAVNNSYFGQYVVLAVCLVLLVTLIRYKIRSIEQFNAHALQSKLGN